MSSRLVLGRGNMSTELEEAAEYVAQKVACQSDHIPPIHKPMNTDVFRIFVGVILTAITLMLLIPGP
jgi:hypothetical protein